ncbi:MAG: sigma-70 family RNA polymerase sigma factor [Sphingobacteriales bacterium]|nr:sigma-70 family RNA polymerase sigma factor [Sphingobacteriales bacterium]MBI3718126.1 sigma-70 family RNA polymerase sigma factor [Sphingobacteriales bacterium]
MSQQEFLELIKAHQPLIHKVCHLYGQTPMDKQDLFQEIVIQTWKAYNSFRGESKFSTWLYRIALNTAISSYRKNKRTISTIDIEGLPVELPASVYDFEKEDKLKQLYTAIAKLTEVERAIVMLYLDDKSYEEMEEVLGINQNNLRVKMNRIKDKLRQLTKNEVYGTG